MREKIKSCVDNSPQTALVITGASGFIGLHLIKKAVLLGQKVIVVDKAPPPGIPKKTPYRFIRCDLSRKGSLSRLLAIKEKINLIHLAACVPHVPSNEKSLKEVIFKINVDGTRHLLEVLSGKLNKVCYVSTLEVYGAPVYTPINETHPTRPLTLYGESKLLAEKVVRSFCRAQGIPWSVMRLSVVYGPGENYERAIPNFIRAAIRGDPLLIFGDGSDRRDYLFVGDAVDALLCGALKKTARGVFNVASGKDYSIKATAKTIVRLCKSRSPITFCARKKARYDLIFDTAKAKQKLALAPRANMADGLREEIAWFRKQ